MARYIKYDLATGFVVQDSETNGTIPGAPIGSAIIDVSGRPEAFGSLAGKIYDPGAGIFSAPAPPAPTANDITRTALLAKASSAWTLTDVADFLKTL